MVLAPKSTNTKIHTFFPSSQPNSKTREPSSQSNRGFFSTQIDPSSQSQSSPEGTYSYNELRRLSRLPFISSSQDIDDDDDFQPSPFRRLQRQRSSGETKEKAKEKTKAKAKAVAPSSSASNASQPSTSSTKQKTPPKRTRRQPSAATQSKPRSPVIKKERQATPAEDQQFVFEDLSSMIKKERGAQPPGDDDIALEFDDISDLIKKEKGGVQPKEEEDAFTFDGDDLSNLIKKERTSTQQNEPENDDALEWDDLSSLIKEERKRPRVQLQQERQDDVHAMALLDDIYDRPSSASHTHRRHSPHVFTPTPSPPPAQRRRLASPVSLADSSEPAHTRARRASLIQHQPRRSPPRFPGPDVRPQVPRSQRQQDSSQHQQQRPTLDTLYIPRSSRNTRPHERGSQETTPCPLCQQDFPTDTIEAHASDCKGLVAPTATSSSMASTSASAREECPVCGEYIPAAELERHVNEELEANEQAAASEAGPSGTSYPSFSSSSIADTSHIHNSSNTNDDASGIESDSDCSLLDLTAEPSQTHSVADPGFPTPSASADEPETVELFSEGEDEGEGDATGPVGGFESILGQRENPDLQVYFNQLDPDRRNARSTRGRGNSAARGGSSSRSSNPGRSSGNGSGRGSSSRYDAYGRPKWYFKKKKSARGSRSTGGSKGSKSKGKGRGKGK